VRDVVEASGRHRHWLESSSKRHRPTRALLAAVVVIMRGRGYTDDEITLATGVRALDTYSAAADRLLVRRLKDRLRKAGR
jgi:hypothetical protein